MPSPTKKVHVGACVFEVCENVYEPAEDSFLFAENFRVAPTDRVLDMGTGTGVLGVLAARAAREVVAIDINPFAVRCAKKNAEQNQVDDKMMFVQADLFTSLHSQVAFDVILFNAPYVPTEEAEENSWLGRAWAGGATGRQVIDRFTSQAPSHLRQGGRLFLMQSTLAGVEATRRDLTSQGLRVGIVAELCLPFFETLVLLRAEKTGEIRGHDYA
ncbi:MAG: HemK2/MTQ2 family protein methyltransferase [Candidatus Bathyarchaeia archaeon]